MSVSTAVFMLFVSLPLGGKAASATTDEGARTHLALPQNVTVLSGYPGLGIDTNAPVFMWNTTVGCIEGSWSDQQIFSIRINVTKNSKFLQRNGHSYGGEQDDAIIDNGIFWTSGEVYQQCQGPWTGLYVYEGPDLSASTSYLWTAEERILAEANGDPSTSDPFKVVGMGEFCTQSQIPTGKEEAAKYMQAANMSKLWNGSWHSVVDRIVPTSGFLPTSVSGGYGGITQEYVRDASGQLIGVMQLGPQFYPMVEKALRFMLQSLKDAYTPSGPNSYAPHVMQANKNLTKIISFDATDQTDDTFYLITAWGRYIHLTKDKAMLSDFYDLLKNYSLHYLGSGARSEGREAGNKHIGGGVLYWNETLSLLWNPNLEHSRLGSFWSCYDTLTNSFAAEGLKYLADAAQMLGLQNEEKMWSDNRTAILKGLDDSLTYQGWETEFRDIYAELRGHPNDFTEDTKEPGYSPLLWGLSYENTVPVILGMSELNSSKFNTSKMAELGLNTSRLQNTWNVYRKAGVFQWVTPNPQDSAFVPATHLNSSGWIDPPTVSATMLCNNATFLRGKDALTLALGTDICDPTLSTSSCSHIASPEDCCASCVQVGCKAWFFDGHAKICQGSGCCHLKSDVAADNVTKPNNNFFAAKGLSPPCDPDEFLKGADALTLGSGPDLCDPTDDTTDCSKASTPNQCCAMCMKWNCGDWFFNGNVTTCSGHGCCYVKEYASPDNTTQPNPFFYAGKGNTGSNWCRYTGVYNKEPVCPAYRGKSCGCPSVNVIGKAIGWELGWAAYKKHWTRLIVLHRWLGAMAHVEQTTLFAESYGYQCIKNGEANGFNPPISKKNPRGANCWGDPGNGVQIGWFLWGEALARSAAGLQNP